MSEQKRYCRTCHWGVRGNAGQVDFCIRLVAEDVVEGPRIVPLNPRGERSFFGGCGPSGKYWEAERGRTPGMMDERLIP